MYINPKTAIQEGWISHPSADINWDDFVQPNAIDFTLDRLFSINEHNAFIISEEKKTMRGGDELPVVNAPQYPKNSWHIKGHTVYDGMSDFYVKVPDGVVVVPLVVRSTLNRNGIFITSGIYDTGFEGHMGFALHNRSGQAFIAKGTRVGQIAFVESASEGKYAGGYNHEQGTHYSEKDGE